VTEVKENVGLRQIISLFPQFYNRASIAEASSGGINSKTVTVTVKQQKIAT
jgi:hypothetical protein